MKGDECVHDTVRRVRCWTSAVMVLLFIITGCASTASTPAPNKGIKLYRKGAEVYVCRESHTAPTVDELKDRLQRGGAPQDSPTGQTVRIAQRDSIQVEGSTTHVARVEATQADASYWIPYMALCSKD